MSSFFSSSMVMVGSRNGSLRAIDCLEWNRDRAWSDGKTGSVITSISISVDEPAAVIGTQHHGLLLHVFALDAEFASLGLQYAVPHNSPILDACFLSRWLLAFSDARGRCYLWKRAPGEKPCPVANDEGGGVICSLRRLSPSVFMGLATVGELRFWHVPDGRLLGRVQVPPPSALIHPVKLQYWPMADLLVWPARRGHLASYSLVTHTADAMPAHDGELSREVLGSLILSMLHRTALGRSILPPDARRPFHIYCDEAHRFLTDTLEDMLVETRKFKVSLTLAHQHMKQFDAKKADALSGVGTAIVFRVNEADAQQMAKRFERKVDPEELMSLENWNAMARIGRHMVKIQTYPSPAIAADHCREEIIAQSRARYYRPAHVVRRQVRDRQLRWREPLTRRGPVTGRATPATRTQPGGTTQPSTDGEEFRYEEL